MDQVLLVRRREPAPRRDEDVEDLQPGPALGLQPVAKRVSIDELHRDEHPFVERVGLVDDDDVGMGDARRRLSLAHQAAAIGLAVRLVVAADQLDRDLTVEVRIVGGVDLAHGAPADEAQDHEAPERRAVGERRRGSGRWLLVRQSHDIRVGIGRLASKLKLRAYAGSALPPTRHKRVGAGGGGGQ